MLLCNETERGYVLLAALILMQIISLLSFFELMFVSMRLKQNHHQLIRDEALWKAQQVLKQIEHRVLADSILCKINVIDPIQIISKPISWWERVSCSGKLPEIRYYYAVEFLGQDACAEIRSIKYQSILEYYRITLFVLLRHIEGAKIFLQSTVIKAGNQISICTGKLHHVDLGRQMSREL